VLFRSGTFDGSSGEFKSQDINYADPKSDPVFVVGQSSDKDWYRFQPGPANGIAGGRPHPFTVKFVLNDAPPFSTSIPSSIFAPAIGKGHLFPRPPSTKKQFRFLPPGFEKERTRSFSLPWTIRPRHKIPSAQLRQDTPV